MNYTVSRSGIRPVLETLEGRTLASASPSLMGLRTLPTRTVLTVEAGTLGQPITFQATVFAPEIPVLPVDFYYRGKLLQEVGVTPISAIASTGRLPAASEATLTVPAGPASAEMFGVGLHAVRASSVGMKLDFAISTAVALFGITRPQFVTQPSGVGTAILAAGSGPALQPGQTATIQYDAYLAASYRLFDSSARHTPDTQTFVVGANPEQVIPGLDAGVLGMQAGETRAIYVPYALGYGRRGARPVPPRANLVYLVTLVSVG